MIFNASIKNKHDAIKPKIYGIIQTKFIYQQGKITFHFFGLLDLLKNIQMSYSSKHILIHKSYI